MSYPGRYAIDARIEVNANSAREAATVVDGYLEEMARASAEAEYELPATNKRALRPKITGSFVTETANGPTSEDKS